MSKTILLFDTETNGWVGKSVLSLSVMKIEHANGEFKEISRETRYYHVREGEKFNPYAANIHGLTKEVIEKHRDGVSYPLYFDEDFNFLYDYLKDVDILVGHNAKFDKSFYPEMDERYPKLITFCTMTNNTQVIKLYGKKKGTFKWPKLEEAAFFYKVSTAGRKLHDSMVDVEVTYDIFKKMKEHNVAQYMIEDLLSE